ncbi:MAG: hypothetical protein A2233_05005 [Candidatus Kerfeldbacteria bacterium RIFOXYA2_FULL_38_24]|uniref:YknX-like beta-barrel domain-containing protein n=1 Tax=Candidatus Kerfeldbacteria bacterium RIFOXYB2_FULL_38_14 TaxID=1798547 RepID=A0A1G2B915_9BACT|nr:MAG: hypothetical protein A2233_05005 [Candidatus Kerfeldbacteria bacterium RIFOXYA2_FULL_38_24]OGY85684.1 MAG: hypothetical protein A2319_05275 [Candidatus Kerfeldbacteria bacterium RIFOXYB2_FULL_38_14]OGY88370.1 MAG: hypothetical protein A2458_02810 [Candidatus Kerfeldbacteria bacterium RIFOXYC2_FULL_38_9]
MKKTKKDRLKTVISLLVAVGIIGFLIFLITYSPAENTVGYEPFTVTKRDVVRSFQATGVVVENLINQENERVVVVVVDEYEVTDLATEQTANLTIGALKDTTTSGKIYSISDTPRVNGDTSEYDVVIRFEKQPDQLRLGMHVDVNVVLEDKKNVLAVLNDSLNKQDNSRYYVEMLTEVRRISLSKIGLNKVAQETAERQVEIGLQGDDYTEIIDGLKEGEVIVK